MEKKELQEQIRQKEEEIHKKLVKFLWLSNILPLTALIIAIINLVRK